MGSACSDNRTAIEKQVDEFLYMLRNQPDLKKYRGSKTNNATFVKAWGSAQFGGNVFSALGARYEPKDKKGSWRVTSRDRKNTLEQCIKKMQINALHGGGYYVLEGVRQSDENENYFMDIYLLTDVIPDEMHLTRDNMKRLSEACIDKYLPAKLRKGTVASQQYSFEDLKQGVTGYARIVYYKSNNGTTDPDHCELEQIVEGEFNQGKIEGYSRGISAINGSCSAGFHHDGIPNGKWCYYKADGTFSQTEGIYEGQRCIQAMEIKTFEQPILKKNTATA